jgi:hypothetical protein
MSSLKHLKEELEKIKTDGKSFLGMDGGNINADIWVCGIEFGSNLEQMESYYQTHVKYYNHKGYNVPYRENCPEYFLKSTYDRFLTAMYIRFFTVFNLTPPVDTKEIEGFLRTELYHKDSQIFKLNLYPIAKKDTGWDKTIEDELGIKKENYYGDIFKKRMLFIKKLVANFTPKIIICTSPKDYENKFIEAFFDRNEKINYSFDYLELDKKQFKISEYDNGKTKVIIIPFLGRGNLGSYEDVLNMGEYLAKKYIDDIPF